jgi:hypothetical protein
MKATLTFNLPEEQEDFEYAVKGHAAFSALSDVRDQIFRPARKHGYRDSKINALIEKLGDDGTDLIHHLECQFQEILHDLEIDRL